MRASGDEPLTPSIPAHDRYYTPERIAYRLRNWGELCALAETPNTARGLLEQGPTRESLRTGAKQQGFKSDQLGWAAERADLDDATGLLNGAELDVVLAIRSGRHMEDHARRIQKRTAVVYASFRSACRRMAEHLGWREERKPYHDGAGE